MALVSGWLWGWNFSDFGVDFGSIFASQINKISVGFLDISLHGSTKDAGTGFGLPWSPKAVYLVGGVLWPVGSDTAREA